MGPIIDTKAAQNKNESPAVYTGGRYLVSAVWPHPAAVQAASEIVVRLLRGLLIFYFQPGVFWSPQTGFWQFRPPYVIFAAKASLVVMP